jgi:hypothetical protein
LHAFLVMEAADLGRYRDLLLQIEGKRSAVLLKLAGSNTL